MCLGGGGEGLDVEELTLVNGPGRPLGSANDLSIHRYSIVDVSFQLSYLIV